MIDVKDKLLQGYRFIDLFSGIGGFRLALESFGATCVFSSEIDKYASEVYENNFGETPAGDITQVNEANMPNYEILCGGFPCQAFSISGKQQGFEDTRGTLFFHIARIVKEKQPLVVLLENVKNFVKHNNGETFQTIKNIMEELNYDFYFKVLNACDFGVPQKRERLYIVCFRKDLNIKDFQFPTSFTLNKYVEDILLPYEETKHLICDRKDVIFKQTLDNEKSFNPIRIGTVGKGCQGERIYSVKGTAITLSAYGGGAFAKTGGYLINGNIRKLHPRECARLTGFPDSFILAKSNNQAYKQFGNSVVVDVLQYILYNIAEELKKGSYNGEQEFSHSEK